MKMITKCLSNQKVQGAYVIYARAFSLFLLPFQPEPQNQSCFSKCSVARTRCESILWALGRGPCPLEPGVWGWGWGETRLQVAMSKLLGVTDMF